MSTTEDISWQVLRRIVHDWLGSSAELEEVKPLYGGCINTTLALKTRGGEKAVLKISPHRVNRAYEHEAAQLRLLKHIGLPTPEIYLVTPGTLDEPFSYLLIEFIEGVDLSEAKRTCGAEHFDRLQERLATLVCDLHDHTRDSYGRVIDNAPSFDSWPRFYHDIYDVIWREVEKSASLPVKCRKQISKVHEQLDRLLGHSDIPRLVHWDIWSTNLLVRPDEAGEWQIAALLDPNCKYAHAEAEIAYMELFHTVTGAFTKAYQRRHKLAPDYHQYRKPVYQLYTLINHLHLFGQEYLKPLLGAVERVSALV